MKLLLSFILFLSFLMNAFALTSKVITKANLGEIKKQIAQEIKETKSPIEAFSLYSAAANEFMSYRFYKEAQFYYLEANKLNATVNKSSNYINLLAVTSFLNEKESLEKFYKEAKTYLEKNPSYQTKSITDYLNSMSLLLHPESDAKIDKTMYETFVTEEKIKSFILLKKYQMAFDLFKDTKIKEINNGKLQVTYDLLNTLLNKPQSLLCEKEYSAYPNAVTYASMYCKLLKEKRKEITIPKEERRNIITYLEKESEENSYLYQIYKEIK